MKNRMLVFLALFIVMGALAYAAPAEKALLVPYQESTAYKQYQHRPKNELSRLLYVMDRYKGTAYKVIFNNIEYDSTEALRYAKSYIAKQYNKENAMEWVKDRAYKSPSGQIIYLKDPNEKLTVLRDALIAELEPLS